MNEIKKNKNMFESDIEDKLKEAKISYGTALILSDMDKQERVKIYELLEKVQLGANKMKEVVENIYEISKRDFNVHRFDNYYRGCSDSNRRIFCVSKMGNAENK